MSLVIQLLMTFDKTNITFKMSEDTYRRWCQTVAY